jgi:hypothetical protein
MPSSATPADEADPSGSDVGSLGLLRSDQPTISWSFSRLFRLRLELEAGRRPGLVGTGGIAVEVPSKPGHRHPPPPADLDCRGELPRPAEAVEGVGMQADAPGRLRDR